MINKYIVICLIIVVGFIPLTITTFNQFVKAQQTVTLGMDETKMHLEEAIKALKAGDTSEALMHIKEAIKTISGVDSSMHLEEAIKALKAGDTSEALMHLSEALKTL